MPNCAHSSLQSGQSTSNQLQAGRDNIRWAVSLFRDDLIASLSSSRSISYFLFPFSKQDVTTAPKKATMISSLFAAAVAQCTAFNHRPLKTSALLWRCLSRPHWVDVPTQTESSQTSRIVKYTVQTMLSAASKITDLQTTSSPLDCFCLEALPSHQITPINTEYHERWDKPPRISHNNKFAQLFVPPKIRTLIWYPSL